VINVSGNPFGHAAVYVFSDGPATALTANVKSLIESVGPADPTTNPGDPANLPTGIRANNSGGNAPIDVTYTGPGITTVGGNGVGILAQSGSGSINVTSSGPITSTGEFGSGIVATTGNAPINITSGGSVMGGWQPDLTSVGPALGLPAAGVILNSTGGPATLTNNGSIGALSDRAVANPTSLSPFPASNNTSIINNGTITGFVQLVGSNNSIVNNGTFDLRHFADTTGNVDASGNGVRDTLRVAVSDLGPGTFTITERWHCRAVQLRPRSTAPGNICRWV
jgi:autotransporter family porin